jgi:hypothetical protein
MGNNCCGEEDTIKENELKNKTHKFVSFYDLRGNIININQTKQFNSVMKITQQYPVCTNIGINLKGDYIISDKFRDSDISLLTISNIRCLWYGKFENIKIGLTQEQYEFIFS